MILSINYKTQHSILVVFVTQVIISQYWLRLQICLVVSSCVKILEQQLQQMKATYQLNQEKLEYNFQVSQLTCTYISKSGLLVTFSLSG